MNIVNKDHQSGQDSHVVPAFADKSEAAPVPDPPDGNVDQQDGATGRPTPAMGASVEPLLAGILEQLKRMQKTEIFDEFSLLRLLAGILQVFVPFCLLVALWLLTNSSQSSENVFVALGFGAVLQLMALTFYIMNWRR